MLIDRDSLLKKFDTGALLFESDIRKIIEEEPEAVVRCKDCKHLFDGEHNANCCDVLMEKAKWITEITVDENWYCPEWERRIDDCI